MPDAAAHGPHSHPALSAQEVALVLAGSRFKVPGYWSIELDVHDRPALLLPDGRVWRRAPLEARALHAFEAHRDILADSNYRISLTADPATSDFLELMRAKMLVSQGRDPLQIVIAEEQEVIAHAPETGQEPEVIERRTLYRRLSHPEAPLAEGTLVFDLSDDGGRAADGGQIPVEIPGARVIGWSGLRNRQQLLHESYALAAVESLIARATRLGAQRSDAWAIYVGRQAQPAVAVLRVSRGFYAGRMIPILVRDQWRHDTPGTEPSWRPLALQLHESHAVA
jgi:hypothetical protein